MVENEKQFEIELFREDMKFSVAHFTIFSETNRELLHGHNYRLHVTISAYANDNDMVFDYRWYRDKLLQLCRSLDGHCLMPALSKYLKYKQTKDEYEFLFTNQRIILPKADVLLMPLKNITTESLAEWFLDKICNEIIEPENKFINVVSTKISSYSGQYARISRKIS